MSMLIKLIKDTKLTTVFSHIESYSTRIKFVCFVILSSLIWLLAINIVDFCIPIAASVTTAEGLHFLYKNRENVRSFVDDLLKDGFSFAVEKGFIKQNLKPMGKESIDAETAHDWSWVLWFDLFGEKPRGGNGPG